MGRAGRRESLAALGAAMDAGITFYDTARSYGYGESETLLGEFFAGRRHSVVLCTKFGILPVPKGGWKQKAKPLAQIAVRMFPALRKHARRHAADQMQAGQFSLDVLKASFETSLRELRTEYVDMLLLHGATSEVLRRDELVEAMGRLVEQGKVRMAGFSSEPPVVLEALARGPGVLTTAQFPMNRTNLGFSRHTSQAHGLFLVANHPFGGVAGVASTAERVEQMRTSERLPAELRAKLDGRDPRLMPEIVLNVILNGTGVSAVVPAMMRPENLRNNALAVEQCRFTALELGLLRDELIGAS